MAALRYRNGWPVMAGCRRLTLRFNPVIWFQARFPRSFWLAAAPTAAT